tara:strand:- start:149 stop:421 length:273 start_codon:yes stop_codon:yes gene_type:complete
MNYREEDEAMKTEGDIPKLSCYDYIIIGAGAAGCVVANRLSENPENTVCLIEAGASDKSPWIQIPAGIFGLYGNKKFMWAHLNNISVIEN